MFSDCWFHHICIVLKYLINYNFHGKNWIKHSWLRQDGTVGYMICQSWTRDLDLTSQPTGGYGLWFASCSNWCPFMSYGFSSNFAVSFYMFVDFKVNDGASCGIVVFSVASIRCGWVDRCFGQVLVLIIKNLKRKKSLTWSVLMSTCCEIILLLFIFVLKHIT